MEIQPQEIRQYIKSNGKIPFDEWLESLKVLKTRTKIETRLKRLKLGNFGDCKSVGEGVYELRINYGSGYRIYFGKIGKIIILLLCGGDKSSQNQDILKAKEYWNDYIKHEKN
jgi:putative addiction module killer protein